MLDINGNIKLMCGNTEVEIREGETMRTLGAIVFL
jgi:hypothetical protein